MSQPATKNDVAYIIFCLLLDASDIAFGMRILRVSTFFKRLARQTDERWKLGQKEADPESMEDSPEDAIPAASVSLQRGADRLAYEVNRLIDSGALGSRTPQADALLDYATDRFGCVDAIGELKRWGEEWTRQNTRASNR